MSLNIDEGKPKLDVNTIGTYTLTYSASDAAGNGATSVTRTVVEKAGSGVTTLSYTQFPFSFSFDTAKDKSYIVKASGNLLKWN